MIHQPYLQVTLSTKPLGWESRRGVTLQYVMLRKRRRAGRATGGEVGEGEGEENGAENRVEIGEEPVVGGSDIAAPAPAVTGVDKEVGTDPTTVSKKGKRKPDSGQGSQNGRTKKRAKVSSTAKGIDAAKRVDDA